MATQFEFGTDRWERIKQSFLEVVSAEPKARAAELERIGREDSELAELLGNMLAADLRFGETLDSGTVTLAMETSDERWADLARAALPEAIGSCRILRLLGEGAFGLVYEGEQENPRRRVAVKLLRPGVVSAGALRRFREEARVLAKLELPGVARVFGAGVLPAPDGRPYLVMEFVDGDALLKSGIARDGTLQERAELLAKVCDAVQSVHANGVLHRDLKPDNIMVTHDGEPKLLDFGVAKLTGIDAAQTIATSSGEFIGTAPYMSPEQASGEALSVDSRTDVYALGAIAYHVFAGVPPVDTAGLPLGEVLARVRAGPRRRLCDIRPELGGDIDAVIHKALSLEKQDRYASAAELGQEVRRICAGEPVLVRPPGLARQMKRFVRRNPGFSMLAMLTMIMLVIGAFWLARLKTIADQNFDAARRAADVLLNQVMTQLEPMTGSLETRRKVVEELREPLARFAEARPDDLDLQFNWARLLSAEADIAEADRRIDEAGLARVRAEVILRALNRVQPANAAWTTALSIALVRRGDAAHFRNDRETAEAHYRESLRLDADLALRHPGDVGIADNLVWSYARLAELMRYRNPPMSAGLFEKQAGAVDHLFSLNQDRPGSLYAKLQTMATAASRRPIDAAGVEIGPAFLDERVKLGARLVSLAPRNRGYVVRYLTDLVLASDVAVFQGRFAEAQDQLERAREVLGSLDETDSVFEDYKSARNTIQAATIKIFLERGDVERAHRMSLAFIETLGGPTPDGAEHSKMSVPARVALSTALVEHSLIEMRLGHSERASRAIEEAIRIAMPTETDKNVRALVLQLAWILANPGGRISPQPGRAMSLAAELSRRHPAEPATLVLSGLAKIASGDSAGGRLELERVLQDGQGNSDGNALAWHALRSIRSD